MNDATCPYCDQETEICHDDGQGYREDELHNQECHKCGKTFAFYTSISFDYSTQKADCLNEGGEHKFKLAACYPEQFAKERCETCDEERKPATPPRATGLCSAHRTDGENLGCYQCYPIERKKECLFHTTITPDCPFCKHLPDAQTVDNPANPA